MTTSTTLTSPCYSASLTFTPASDCVVISSTNGSVEIPTENARDAYRALRAQGWRTDAEIDAIGTY